MFCENRNETHEVIKYLEYCVHRLQNEDPGIHNLLLSLYAKQVGFLNRVFIIFAQVSRHSHLYTLFLLSFAVCYIAILSATYLRAFAIESQASISLLRLGFFNYLKSLSVHVNGHIHFLLYSVYLWKPTKINLLLLVDSYIIKDML